MFSPSLPLFDYASISILVTRPGIARVQSLFKVILKYLSTILSTIQQLLTLGVNKTLVGLHMTDCLKEYETRFEVDDVKQLCRKSEVTTAAL
jgi:hypothetical protein